MLPAPIWFRIFHRLHLPPSQPDVPAILAQRKTPEHPAAMAERWAREAEWFRTPGFTAWQPWGHPASSAGLTAWGQLGQPASSAGLTSQPSQPASSTGVTAQLGLPASSTGVTAQLGLPASSTGVTAQLGLPASSTGATAWGQVGQPASSAGLTASGQMGQPASSAARALQMFHAEFGRPGHLANSTQFTPWGQMGHSASSTGITAWGQMGHSASSAGLTAWDQQGDPASSTGLPSQLGQLGLPAGSTGVTAFAAHALQMFHAEFGNPGHPASSAGPTAWDWQGDPASNAQRETGTDDHLTHTDHLTNTKIDRDRPPVVFREEGLAAREQHKENADTYGASWALLCCALASKRLLNLVVAFSESQPISLCYGDQNPHWMRSVRFFLTRASLRSLHLRFSSPDQLPTLGACIARSSPSLSSLRLELQGTVGSSKHQGNDYWKLGFLKECAQLRELNLGRGMWVLNRECAGAAAWFKSIRNLTLEQVHFKSLSFQFLQSITPQLHEFTLYEDGNVLREHPRVPSTSRLALSFPNARLLRFRFAATELHLTLSVSPAALKTLSVIAKRLVLSCKSTTHLALHHLSLYGQERLIISSLRLASARVVYLDGPASDQEGFSWTEWLGIVAPTVEVLIVRHGVPIKKVEAEWGRLLSLGIVVPPWDRDARANSWSMGYGTDAEGECEEHLDDGRLRFSWADDLGYFSEEPDEEVDEDDYIFDDADVDEGDADDDNDDDDDDDDADDYGGVYGVGGFGGDDYDRQFWAMYGPAINAKIRERERLMKAVFKPPSIRAPNLRFLFFPTRKACNAPALAALRQDYPALALYCVVDRSFYWHRKGVPVSNVPFEHVRRAKSGVWDEEEGEKRAKKVGEKLHSVNRKLVEGFCAEEDQTYVLQYQQK
ncbi:unnamed protein product [Closterium sp. Naga37s-1]|nr:unnamed protein product [Closterium sp. Naga37s-1]